ncbi:MAG: hypothetical protein LWW93_04295 [Hyphomicrobiales bacterium]|nr:hypothetical protein [Hyphomicrobiales bacterium]
MNDVDLKAAIEMTIEGKLLDIATDEIGVGLGSLVDRGRIGFRLEGDALIDFVRRVIVGLVAGGASPEDDGFVTPDNPRGLAHFGADTPEEVADGVVAAWVAAGAPDPEWGDWRFNTPRNRALLDEAAESIAAYKASQKT